MINTNENINNEVSFTDSHTESQINSDSGIHTNESNVDESKIRNEIEIHSTPISMNQNKKVDDSSMLKDLYSLICSMKEISEKQHNEVNNKFDKLSNDFDRKFDRQKSSFYTKFDIQNNKFDELKNQINEINKHLENIHEIFENNFKKLEQNIERMGVWGINIGKNNTDESDGNICINGSGSSLDTKKVTIDKVSNNDNYNNELMSDNSGVIQNVGLESRVVSRESVDEMGSVCDERLDRKRANFPQVYGETDVSQMLYEDRVSSSGSVEDEVS